jgi:hypothetical protein
MLFHCGFYGTNLQRCAPALPSSIRLGVEMTVSDKLTTIAHYSMEFIITVRSFVVQAHGQSEDEKGL